MRTQPNACTVGNSKAKPPLSFRWALIGWGLITFIWLPFEDRTTLFLLLLSAGWCVLFGSRVIQRLPTDSKPIIPILSGALGGLLVLPAALLLVLIKAGLHDHGFLDFSTSQLLGIVRSTPFWVIIGALMSTAYHYLRAQSGNEPR
jgi:hypothetical protein